MSPRQLLTTDYFEIIVGVDDVQAGISHIDKLSSQKRVLPHVLLLDEKEHGLRIEPPHLLVGPDFFTDGVDGRKSSLLKQPCPIRRPLAVDVQVARYER